MEKMTVGPEDLQRLKMLIDVTGSVVALDPRAPPIRHEEPTSSRLRSVSSAIGLRVTPQGRVTPRVPPRWWRVRDCSALSSKPHGPPVLECAPAARFGFLHCQWRIGRLIRPELKRTGLRRATTWRGRTRRGLLQFRSPTPESVDISSGLGPLPVLPSVFP